MTYEQQRNAVRDEMLVDMARGIQVLLQSTGNPSPELRREAQQTVVRLEGHIDFLKDRPEGGL